MTYNPAIPQSTDLPSLSQGQILVNFDQANTLFGANHYPFDYATAALRGVHQFVQLEAQAAGPVTSATQGALYTKTVGAQPNLFWRRLSSGAEIQMTANATPVFAANGYTFLPGGILLQWGQINIPGGDSAFLFPTAFSAVPYSITLQFRRSSGAGSGSTVYVRDDAGHLPTATQFETVNGGGGHDAYYMAIGPAA